MPDNVAWVDGSCSGNPGPGAWACVLSDGRELVGSEKDTTNNAMEFRAVMEAIMAYPDGSEILVNSDSQLVIKCLLGEWKPKKMAKHIRALKDCVGERVVSVNWIRAQSCDEHLRADELAKAETAKHKTDPVIAGRIAI